jgi:hypothetical protein
MDGIESLSAAPSEGLANDAALKEWATLVGIRARGVLLRQGESDKTLPQKLLAAMQRFQPKAALVEQAVVQTWLDGSAEPENAAQRLAYENIVGEKGEGKQQLTPEQITAAVNAQLQPTNLPDEATIRHWLAGSTVPESPELHAQLLEALELPATPKANGKGHALNGTAKPSNDPRFLLNVLYAQIDHRYRTREPESIAHPKARTPRQLAIGKANAMGNTPHTDLIRHTRAGQYGDNPAIPRRKKMPGTVYQELAASEVIHPRQSRGYVGEPLEAVDASL